MDLLSLYFSSTLHVNLNQSNDMDEKNAWYVEKQAQKPYKK